MKPPAGADNGPACQKVRMHLSDIVAHMQEAVHPIRNNLQSQCLRLDNDLHHKTLDAEIVREYDSQWEGLGKEGEGVTFLFIKELLIAIKGGRCKLRIFSTDELCFTAEATFDLSPVTDDDPFAKRFFFYRVFSMIYSVVENHVR